MDFKDNVRCQCSQAAKAGPPEDISILSFVHEELKKKEDRDRLWSCIGTCGSAHLQGEMRSKNANVSLLTNACYSECLTFYPRFNISSMTAPGEQKDESVVGESGSSGRACGSMYTSIIINKLVYNSACFFILYDLMYYGSLKDHCGKPTP